MNKLNWGNVRLILRRELRDQLRDRRTLFMIVVLPLMLYPLIAMAFLQIGQFMKQHASNVLIVSANELPDSPPLVTGNQIVFGDGVQPMIEVEVQSPPSADINEISNWAMQKIDEGSHDAVIYFPPRFDERISAARGEQPPKSVDIEQELQGDAAESRPEVQIPEPHIFFNTAKDKSRVAFERADAALAHWRSQIVDDTLEQHELPKSAVQPFEVQARDVAQEVGKRAAMWSKILPFVVLVWSLTGAFYPAVDLCAGEKERGTLETLLSSPAERVEIVWGKLLTIMIFSISTALLNLSCMCVTATFVIQQFQATLQNSPTMIFGAPPLASMGWLVVAVVPISALFSALALALATMAGSTKEGQYYLMPMLLVSMPLMMLAMLPSSELDLGTSLIPVTGVLLMLRHLMEGEYQAVLVYILPVVGVTVLCCWASIRWAVDQFNNENVLFRGNERFELGHWLIHVMRDRGPTPGVAEAFLCGILILIIRFFAGMSMGTPDSWNSFMMMTVVTMIAFIATPALVMAVMLTTHPRKTLLLQAPSDWRSIPAVILLAVALHPLAIGLSAVIRYLYPMDMSMLEPLQELISKQSPSMWHVLGLMALLPAICEELAFRGFILSGLRHSGSRWRAILVSAAFFGVTHGILQQSILATVFGVVLGYVAVQARSLIPCILFHFTFNALSISYMPAIEYLTTVLPGLKWLFLMMEDGIPAYNWPIMLAALAVAVPILNWFRQLPFQPTAEERIRDRLERQPAVNVAAR